MGFMTFPVVTGMSVGLSPASTRNASWAVSWPIELKLATMPPTAPVPRLVSAWIIMGRLATLGERRQGLVRRVGDIVCIAGEPDVDDRRVGRQRGHLLFQLRHSQPRQIDQLELGGK